jgi:ankyrin repeat protein
MAQETRTAKKKLLSCAKKPAHELATEGARKTLSADMQARIEKLLVGLVAQGDKDELTNQIARLEKAGVDVKQIINASDTDGRTALMHAAAEGRTETCKLLISKGADINKGDSFGWTASMVAGHYGRKETEAYLKSVESK